MQWKAFLFSMIVITSYEALSRLIIYEPIIWSHVGYRFIAFIIIGLLALYFFTGISKPFTRNLLKILKLAHNIRINGVTFGNISNILKKVSQDQRQVINLTQSNVESIHKAAIENKKETATSIEFSHSLETLAQTNIDFIGTMTQHQTSVEESLDDLSKIVDFFDKIKNKTSEIKQIVTKLQFLSFNARITSEEAGIHGREFSIVADEMNILATASGKASGTIFELIDKSDTEIRTLVEAVHRTFTQNQTYAQYVDDISQTLLIEVKNQQKLSKSIYSNISIQVDQTKDIQKCFEAATKNISEAEAFSQSGSTISDEINITYHNLAKEISNIFGFITFNNKHTRTKGTNPNNIFEYLYRNVLPPIEQHTGFQEVFKLPAKAHHRIYPAQIYFALHSLGKKIASIEEFETLPLENIEHEDILQAAKTIDHTIKKSWGSRWVVPEEQLLSYRKWLRDHRNNGPGVTTADIYTLVNHLDKCITYKELNGKVKVS